MMILRITILTILLSCQSAWADVIASVPFQNITLAPNQNMLATYSFGGYSVIFCYTNITSNAGSIAWTYQGRAKSTVLPAYLITNIIYSGELADANGTIQITNNQSVNLFVSCQFAF